MKDHNRETVPNEIEVATSRRTIIFLRMLNRFNKFISSRPHDPRQLQKPGTESQSTLSDRVNVDLKSYIRIFAVQVDQRALCGKTGGNLRSSRWAYPGLTKNGGKVLLFRIRNKEKLHASTRLSRKEKQVSPFLSLILD